MEALIKIVNSKVKENEMETIKYYLSNGRFLGWTKKRSIKNDYLTVKSWLDIGYAIINKTNCKNHIDILKAYKG